MKFPKVRGGGGSKAVWTFFKKTSKFESTGTPKNTTKFKANPPLQGFSYSYLNSFRNWLEEMRKGQDRHVGLSFSFPLFSCLPLNQKSRGTRALHMPHSPLYEVVVPGIVGNLWRWCSILELSILLRLNKIF